MLRLYSLLYPYFFQRFHLNVFQDKFDDVKDSLSILKYIIIWYGIVTFFAIIFYETFQEIYPIFIILGIIIF